MISSISLHALELLVHLGWTEGERSQAQIVTLDAVIQFANPPKACATDQLEDTYCYDYLVTTLKTHLITQSFRLIEHLSQQIYLWLKTLLPMDSSISVRITKQPAITQLAGVSFSYGDSKN